MRKLTCSKWGANPDTLRTTALALCMSTAEYACSTWARSSHARHVDTALNDTCRIITGSIKSAPTHCLYALAGICPPDIRRTAISNRDRAIQQTDNRHPLYGHIPPRNRLPSRKSFLAIPKDSVGHSPSFRETLWLERWNKLPNNSDLASRGIVPSESLAPGNQLGWAVWRSLNRLRTGAGRCNSLLQQMKITQDNKCKCGQKQTMKHLLQCPNAPKCQPADLGAPSEQGLACAKYWMNDI
jgi:hypothetical protein